MRIAVFSDLHGNPYACRAALEAIRAEGELDAIVAAGDLCLGGSDPAGCVDMMQAAGVVGVYGNTETYLFEPESLPPDELHRRKWDSIQPVAYWVLDQLSAQQLDWLRALPFELRFSPTGDAADDLLVVHANPKDVEMMIYPSVEGQDKLWGRTRQADEDRALVDAFAGVKAGVVAFGHFHYMFQRHWRDLLLVGVAGCSLPGIDHDPRARYSLFTWQGSRWRVEQRWVDYDYEAEVLALRASSMPYTEEYLQYFL